MLENEAGPFTVRPPSAVRSPVIVALPVTARFAGLPGVAAPTVSGDVMVPGIATGPFSVVDAGADTVMPPFAVSNPVKVVVPGTVKPGPRVVTPGTLSVPNVFVPGDVMPPLAVNKPVVVVVPV